MEQSKIDRYCDNLGVNEQADLLKKVLGAILINYEIILIDENITFEAIIENIKQQIIDFNNNTKFCTHCNQPIDPDDLNDIFGKYSHKSCDDEYFKRQEKSVKYVDKRLINQQEGI